MFRIMLYKNPYTPRPVDQTKKIFHLFSESSLDSSVRRTRRTLHDLVRCNDFDLFVTFTFDPRRVDRYDMVATYTKMQSWLRRQHIKNNDFKYLIVPEKHQDGAIHFHALMSDYPFSLKKTNVIQNSRRVYNITAFRFGFTNATHVPVDDKDKVGNYIAKYISKDMILLSNRRRYWSSKNLLKPITHYNSVYDLDLYRHLNHKTEILETDYNVIYDVPKTLFDF